MAKSAIIPKKPLSLEVDIFSNKSSLVLFWLLIHHQDARANGFSINDLNRQTDLSVGLVYKIIRQLEYNGLVASKGLRTKKVFFLKSPEKLLILWIQKYNLIKKTKTLGFNLTDSISQSEEKKYGLIPALHSAANEIYRLKSTNLNTREFYLLDWNTFPKTVEKLDLHEMDRGYELLLIKPYYSALLQKIYGENPTNKETQTWEKAYALLTVLDLCHFPLRGVEQAETLYRKLPYLNSIAPWREVENAIG